jgi:hypothetical protein
MVFTQTMSLVTLSRSSANGSADSKKDDDDDDDDEDDHPSTLLLCDAKDKFLAEQV